MHVVFPRWSVVFLILGIVILSFVPLSFAFSSSAQSYSTPFYSSFSSISTPALPEVVCPRPKIEALNIAGKYPAQLSPSGVYYCDAHASGQAYDECVAITSLAMGIYEMDCAAYCQETPGCGYRFSLPLACGQVSPVGMMCMSFNFAVSTCSCPPIHAPTPEIVSNFTPTPIVDIEDPPR